MTQRELVALPNRDLWRGAYPVEVATPDTVKAVVEDLSPIDRAMENVKFSSRGANELTCLWCGQQGLEPFMKDHIKTMHRSVLEVVDKGQVAMHELGLAQEQLDILKAE